MARTIAMQFVLFVGIHGNAVPAIQKTPGDVLAQLRDSTRTAPRRTVARASFHRGKVGDVRLVGRHGVVVLVAAQRRLYVDQHPDLPVAAIRGRRIVDETERHVGTMFRIVNLVLDVLPRP